LAARFLFFDPIRYGAFAPTGGAADFDRPGELPGSDLFVDCGRCETDHINHGTAGQKAVRGCVCHCFASLHVVAVLTQSIPDNTGDRKGIL